MTQQEEIIRIEELLKIPLSDEAEPLWHELKAVEVWSGRLEVLIAEADAALDTVESQKLADIIRQESSKLPAYEKEVRTRAAASPERQYRDKVKGLLSAIDRRLGLGQTRMAYLRAIYEKGKQQ